MNYVLVERLRAEIALGPRLVALVELLLKLVDKLAKILERSVNGVWSGHVNASAAEQLDWSLGATAGQVADVVLDRRLTLRKDALGQGNSCRETNAVLIDVEVVVEVRDARPL